MVWRYRLLARIGAPTRLRSNSFWRKALYSGETINSYRGQLLYDCGEKEISRGGLPLPFTLQQKSSRASAVGRVSGVSTTLTTMW